MAETSRTITGDGANVRGIRIAIVDNDPLSAAALRTVLTQSIGGLDVAWVATSARQALKLLAGSSLPRTSLLLVDMSMPDMDGIELTRRIRERDGRMAILAMTSFPVDEYAMDVAAAGAQGIVSKGRPADIIRLVKALGARGDNRRPRSQDNHHDLESQAGGDGLRSLMVGGHEITFLTPRQAFERSASRAPQGVERFTPTETEIARMCADGATTQEIASRLGVSAGTVTTHIRRMCRKIGARNRVQLVMLWLEQSRPRR